MRTESSFSLHGLTTSVFLIGVICNAFIQQDTTLLVAYGPIILFLASFAFFKRNVLLIYALLIAIAYPEITTVLQLVMQLFFDQRVPGIAPYMFHPANPLLDFVVSWYHFLLLPLLVHAAYTTRHTIQKVTRLSF